MKQPETKEQTRDWAAPERGPRGDGQRGQAAGQLCVPTRAGVAEQRWIANPAAWMWECQGRAACLGGPLAGAYSTPLTPPPRAACSCSG